MCQILTMESIPNKQFTAQDVINISERQTEKLLAEIRKVSSATGDIRDVSENAKGLLSPWGLKLFNWYHICKFVLSFVGTLALLTISLWLKVYYVDNERYNLAWSKQTEVNGGVSMQLSAMTTALALTDSALRENRQRLDKLESANEELKKILMHK